MEALQFVLLIIMISIGVIFAQEFDELTQIPTKCEYLKEMNLDRFNVDCNKHLKH